MYVEKYEEMLEQMQRIADRMIAGATLDQFIRAAAHAKAAAREAYVTREIETGEARSLVRKIERLLNEHITKTYRDEQNNIDHFWLHIEM